MATTDELHRELEALRAELREMRSNLAPAAPRPSALSRRTLLRAAPVAAVGAAVAALSASPAAAAAGSPVLLGGNNSSGTTTTSITGGNGTLDGPAVKVSGGLLSDGLQATDAIDTWDVQIGINDDAAIYAVTEDRFAGHFIGATGPSVAAGGPNAVKIETTGPGTALTVVAQDKNVPNLGGPPEFIVEPSVAVDISSETGAAVTASSTERVVTAVSTSTTAATDAVTVDYSGTGRAVYAQSHNAANINGTVTGVNEGHGIGVWGEQRNNTGAGFGLVGVGGAQGRGARLSGGAAAAQMLPSTAATHPATGKAGDFFVDSAVRLWFCQKASTTSAAAVWKQLA